MVWYDTFSSFYDLSLKRLYHAHRIEAVKALALEPSDTVVDLACGTGQNFEHIIAGLNESGTLLGVDYSEGMLKRAQKRIDKQKWTQAELLQCDARELDRAAIEKTCGNTKKINKIICVLGLSVIPDWEKVFEKTFDLLEPNGRYVIFDTFAEKKVLQSHIVEWFAEADVSRKTWEPLEKCATDFNLSFQKGSPHVHGGKIFIASGVKA